MLMNHVVDHKTVNEYNFEFIVGEIKRKNV